MREGLIANVTAVAIGGRALVLEGPPASGKSSLALALIDRGAVLIGDDGVVARRHGDSLVLSPPPNTAGLLEIRNVGLVSVPVASAPAALVLALDPDAPRFVETAETGMLAGIRVPRLRFRSGDAVQALRAEYALEKHGLPIAALGNAAETAGP